MALYARLYSPENPDQTPLWLSCIYASRVFHQPTHFLLFLINIDNDEHWFASLSKERIMVSTVLSVTCNEDSLSINTRVGEHLSLTH